MSLLVACAIVATPAHATPQRRAVTTLKVRQTCSPHIDFDWPLQVAAVNSLFGPRHDPLRHRRLQYHYGIDLGAAYGSVVSAMAGGTILVSGWTHGHGRRVCLAHDGGFVTCYSHLAQALVEPGQRVGRRAPLGRLGNSGRSTGPHLHVEVTRDGYFVDPLQVMGERFDLD